MLKTTRVLPRRRRSPRLLAAAVTLVAISTVASFSPAHAQGYAAQVILNGLNNPRGLTFGPDGSLYIAEAGTGGNGPGLTSPEGGTVSYGATGSVTRYQGGIATRVIQGLPSLANQATTPAGGSAVGLTDIAFDSTGTAYGVIGLGAAPSARTTLGEVGNGFGQLVRLDISGGAATSVADISKYEDANDPNGDGKDSNPYGLVTLPDGRILVADAGANAVLSVTGSTVSLFSTFAAKDTPPGQPGGPTYQSVPTAVALSPDGSLFVSELTGFPFPAGYGNIFKFSQSGTALGKVPVAGAGLGFTNVVDIAFGPDGKLYVLELTKTGLLTGPVGGGRLLSVDVNTGAQTIILDDPLIAPGGMAFGNDGSIYVTNLSIAAGGGQVLRIVTVPEPGTLALAPLGLIGLAGAIRRRRRTQK